MTRQIEASDVPVVLIIDRATAIKSVVLMALPDMGHFPLIEFTLIGGKTAACRGAPPTAISASEMAVFQANSQTFMANYEGVGLGSPDPGSPALR